MYSRFFDSAKQPFTVALFLAMFLLPCSSTLSQAADELEQEVPQLPPASEIGGEIEPQQDPFVNVVQEVKQSVVRLDGYSAKNESPPWHGTGFIVGAKRPVIVTNFHVVEGAGSIKITFPDGLEWPADGVWAYDSKQDLAVVAFDLPMHDVKALALAPDVPIGSRVVAVGYPLGMRLIAVGRVEGEVAGPDLPFGADPNAHGAPDAQWMETSAQIEKGNSGGPLITLQGCVAGVNTLVYWGPTGRRFNFASPASKIRETIAQAGDQPIPFEDIPTRERAESPRLQPPSPEGLSGERYSIEKVGQAIYGARASLVCPKCGGSGKIAEKHIEEYVATEKPVRIIQKRVRKREVPCPQCYASGKAWSPRTYEKLARLAKRILFLEESEEAEDRQQKLKAQAREVFQTAALARADFAQACNRKATDVLANPRKFAGKAVVFYGKALSVYQEQGFKLYAIFVYGTEHLVLVPTEETVGTLNGQYCLVAGLCLGNMLVPVEGGAIEAPAVAAFAIEALH